MRGSPSWQVREVFKYIERIGQSKHEAKIAARNLGARTWHQVGKRLGVHSYRTSQQYQKVSRQLLEHARQHYGVKDIEKLRSEHVSSFLRAKIQDGLSKSSLKQYCAAIEKLEVALNRYASEKHTGQQYDFSRPLSEARAEIRNLPSPDHHRAYDRPHDLIQAVRQDEHRLAAQIQLESGARVRETALIRPNQLNPANHSVVVQGKGGKVRELRLSPQTYSRLEEHIARHGEFRINYDQYRRDLREAAERSGQPWTGTHGLRWNYAQERFHEVQREGKTYEEALSEVSHELGHERPDITTGYLR